METTNELIELATTQEKFNRFHELNPDVYKKFKSLALIGISQGRQMMGANQIIEIIRWDSFDLKTKGDKYKINNNYASRYARKFVEDFPQHKEKFKFRALKS